MRKILLSGIVACGVNTSPSTDDDPLSDEPPENIATELPTGDHVCAIAMSAVSPTSERQWIRSETLSVSIDGDRYFLGVPTTADGPDNCDLGIRPLDGVWRATVEEPCNSPCRDGVAEIFELIGYQRGPLVDFRVDWLSESCSARAQISCLVDAPGTAGDAWSCSARRQHFEASFLELDRAFATEAVFDGTTLTVGGCPLDLAGGQLGGPTTCETLFDRSRIQVDDAFVVASSNALAIHLQLPGEAYALLCEPPEA
jgi:hypothetical protein